MPAPKALPLLVLTASAILSSNLAFAQDADLGSKTFKAQCAACHAMDTKTTKIGPHLEALNGRKAGSLPKYAYSTALRNSNLKFDAPTLDAFLANPTGKVPGTKMVTRVSNSAARAAIVSYLLGK